tara:strand:- start:141 stop:335 length:195 start_codon:yes stop_codon:yes gene_type:complete
MVRQKRGIPNFVKILLHKIANHRLIFPIVITEQNLSEIINVEALKRTRATDRQREIRLLADIVL